MKIIFRNKATKEYTITSYSKGLISGAHPPDVEAQIIIKMKDIALSKANKGQWKESYSILKNVSSCEKQLLGNYHPRVANTLYHIGVALDHLDDAKGALSAIQEGIHILYPKKNKDKNIDLAALYYQCGSIKGRQGDYKVALYFLDQAKQIEISVLGNCTTNTSNMISKYEHARTSSRLNGRIRCRAA